MTRERQYLGWHKGISAPFAALRPRIRRHCVRTHCEPPDYVTLFRTAINNSREVGCLVKMELCAYPQRYTSSAINLVGYIPTPSTQVHSSADGHGSVPHAPGASAGRRRWRFNACPGSAAAVTLRVPASFLPGRRLARGASDAIRLAPLAIFFRPPDQSPVALKGLRGRVLRSTRKCVPSVSVVRSPCLIAPSPQQRT